MRSIALSVLVAFSLAIVAPALAPVPAHAAEPATMEGGTPSIPWAKVAEWVVRNALTILLLLEEIWHDTQGGHDTPPPDQPPQHAAWSAA